MKKLLSAAIALCLLLAVSMPFTVYAKDANNDRGMYKVSEKVYADAYMLVSLDDESYPVIAQKNKDKKKYPASLTKIVTAMVTLNEAKNLQAEVTVSKAAIDALSGTDAQVAGLRPGDKLTLEELLYLTMVHSACDACQVLAEYIGGNTPAFCKLMNDWCKSIGCKNSNFVNPDGLHDPDHYTTAADMELITLEALKNETFVKIATTQQYEYGDYTFIHTNFMLDKYHVTYYYEYAEGIKTGSTSQAGYCVITKASKNGYNYLAIVMDSPIKKLDGYDTKCSFIDAATLFDWAFDSLKYSTVIRANDVVSEIPLVNGKDADTIQLVAEKDVTTLVPTNLEESGLMIKPVEQPEELEAPITQGDYVCDAEIYYGGKVIAKTKLVTAKSVELSTFLKIFTALRQFFGNKIVLAVLIILILLVLLYIYILYSRMVKAKKRSAAKRRRREQLDEEMNRNIKNKSRSISKHDDLPPPRR
ncbi:MAG: D-alanyl-D-alanine carboxypeptidase [Eubacterium sp.]|nr:D-alanyl-D-alanine carboxypeptidase [Eubacterium sp.]